MSSRSVLLLLSWNHQKTYCILRSSVWSERAPPGGHALAADANAVALEWDVQVVVILLGHTRAVQTNVCALGHVVPLCEAQFTWQWLLTHVHGTCTVQPIAAALRYR